MNLSNKVALVTGSTSGIGLGIARALAAAGANVLLNGFGDKALIQAAKRDDRRHHGSRHARAPVDELVRHGERNLTVIGNDNARPGIGIGKLTKVVALKTTIASHDRPGC